MPGAAASLPAGNLLIKSAGYTRRGYACKLADFGVSRMLEESQVGRRAGAAGKVPLPEQAQQGVLCPVLGEAPLPMGGERGWLARQTGDKG